MDNTISLLYVDDETILLKLTKLYLERTGDFIVDTASSAKEAFSMIQKQTYDTIISDYQMPEMDGLEFLRALRAEGNNMPFIIFTGKGREEVAIEALNAGADYYLQKGGKPKVQFGELQNFVVQAVKKSRAEVSVVQSEKALLELINAFPNPAFLLNSHGKIIAINQNAINSVKHFMNLSENTSFIGKTAGDLLPPEVARMRCSTIEKAIVTGKKIECYEEYLGQIFKCYISPHFDDNGILKNIAFFQLNITNRRKAKEEIHQKNADLEGSYKELQSKDQELRKNLEELMQSQQQLENNERRLSEIINFLPDATLAIDNEGVVIAWNQAIEQMTGTPVSEMLGKGDYEYALPFYGMRRPILIDLVLHKDLHKDISYPVLRCEDRENIYAEVFSPNLRGGEGAYLWFTATPLYDTDGNVAGAIESIRDITERKQGEDALKTVNEKLNLLSSITRHDILNQITTLMGYEELLKEEIDEEEVRTYLEPMIAATKRIRKQIGFTGDYQDLGVNNPTW
ncbi:MAG: response regulator, partial [Methanogenium sp.]|nr:response regulator [Methanogenium sp.]